MKADIERIDGVTLTQVCQAMRYLNKTCCKNPGCNPATKTFVYRSLKRPLVRWLCENGFCVGVTRESVLRECLCCNGTGTDYVDGRQCRACDGGGQFRPPGYGDSLLGFSFVVNGITYGWHLPESCVNFTIPKLTAPMPISRDPKRVPPEDTFTDKEAMAVIQRFLEAAQWQKAS